MSTRLNRRRLVAALTAVVAAGAVVWGTTPGTMAETPDMTVEKVLVNKLGGVSVVGTVDCSDLAQQVREQGFSYVDENDQWQPLGPVGEGALLNISSSSDNYTVSQPAGRRGMITVTHESSRLSPCYMEKFATAADYDPPCDETTGAPCTWVTDHDLYDPIQPLFDYSADGKFRAGLLAVEAEAVGALVEVFGEDENGPTYGAYYSPYGWGAYTSTTLKAVSYR